MKTKICLLPVLIVAAILYTSICLAQDQEINDYEMSEITYVLPKIGSEYEFVKAVKVHNDLFHKLEPYLGHLDQVLTGNEAGWFVWIMEPCMFSDLDNKPDQGDHSEHWKYTVAPKVAKYGRTEYWRFNVELSYLSKELDKPKFGNIWFIDLKRRNYNRFVSLISKIKEAYKLMDKGSFRVYDNQFNANDGREVAIIWGFKNWAELDKNEDNIKDYFEKMNGKGSWEKALEEWKEITVGVVSQLWEIGVN